jgi:hypothetical protein
VKWMRWAYIQWQNLNQLFPQGKQSQTSHLFCGEFATAVKNKCRKIMMEAVSDYFAILTYHAPLGREINWEDLQSIIQFRFCSICLIQGTPQWKYLFCVVWKLYGGNFLFISEWQIGCTSRLIDVSEALPRTRAPVPSAVTSLNRRGESLNTFPWIVNSFLSHVDWITDFPLLLYPPPPTLILSFSLFFYIFYGVCS